MYPLPARADEAFSDSDYIVRNTVFTVDGITYSICGSGKVQVVQIDGSGYIEIPETVSRNGDVFAVVAIGTFKPDSDLLYYDGSVLAEDSDVSNITIGESIVFIWDGALSGETLTEIVVDTDNAVFASLDGVLFTKSLYTLLQYPAAKSGIAYKTPAQTKQIATGAFKNLAELRDLTFSKSVEVIGIANYGYGYNDSADDARTAVTSDYELPIILGWLASDGSISFEDGNSVFTVIGNGVYLENGGRLLSALKKGSAVTDFELYSEVEVIDAYALYYCVYVEEIEYDGFSTELDNIEYGKNWKPYGRESTLKVVCLDGVFVFTA